MKTYRVGLLVDGYEQPGWMHELVEWLAHSQDFRSPLCWWPAARARKRRRISAPGLSARCPVSSPGCLEASRARLACRDLREHLPGPDTEIVEMTAGGGAGGWRRRGWTW